MAVMGLKTQMSQTNMHIFELLQEAGLKKAHVGGENTYTPHKQTTAEIWTGNHPAVR